MATWDQEELDDLRTTALFRLGQFVAPPLTPGSLTVRGVLPVLEDPGALRVVLWDGERSQAAYDMPLTDTRGEPIPHTVLIPALRACTRSTDTLGAPSEDPASGIPVFDTRAAVHAFAQRPTETPGDALYLPLIPLQGGVPEAPTTFTLVGFLLRDNFYGRYYVRWADNTSAWGLDYRIRNADGSVESRGGTVGHVLRTLASHNDLDRFRTPADDPYCVAAFDLTDWN
ncbi:hypothetical protein [Streptomyces sp. NPDC088400]|uniref:hypothetical protein n=1 Tax=Streptomyces sp. NPDC088400 TaxID=3365861 RepID=UPI003827CBEA